MSEYIEREALIEEIKERNRNTCNGSMSCLQMKRMVEKVPAADAVPVVHGRKIEDGDIGCFWLCSLCGECLPYGANYCPNCGAKMDLEDENNG